MEVIKFGYFDSDDKNDLAFTHELSWSRVYEYLFILNELDVYYPQRIHNCSWGFRDIHVVFKTYLDRYYCGVMHSDIIPSTLYNTEIWDITTPSKYVDEFDVVINVSTIEEVDFDHVEIIKNHLNQVREGGIFIMTFDIPGLQLERVEEFVGQKIQDTEERLNPHNSVLPDKVLGLPDTFNVGYLVIKK